MKAAIWYGQKDVRIEEVPHPGHPASHDVLLEVIYCGICGTDLHEYLEGPIYIPQQPHPLTGQKAPLIIGHEIVARVVEIGAAVTRVKPGDRVALYPVLSCRSCWWCQKERYNQCAQIGYIGTSLNGGFAELTLVPEYNCFKVPAGLSDEEAAVVEPVAAAVRAVKRSGLSVGEGVTVIGAGPIGLAAIQAARAFGADPIIALDTIPARQKMAAAMGATFVLDPRSPELSAVIEAATDGRMTRYVFECVGIPATAELAFKLVAKDGVLMIVGVFDKTVPFNPTDIVNREYTIMGNMGGGSAFDLTLRLMELGKIDAKPFVTGIMSLDQLVAGFHQFINHKESHLKILIAPR